ncbi:MAG: DNA-binding response regulator [Paenibacillus sp.]|jgi:DNA-binding NarL/FixJ family response regulator|nr:DNA-binding response regulator [Paenibacillus sp.]
MPLHLIRFSLLRFLRSYVGLLLLMAVPLCPPLPEQVFIDRIERISAAEKLEAEHETYGDPIHSGTSFTVVSHLTGRYPDDGYQPNAGLAAELTHRERDIVELVAHGCSNREIASQLFIGEGTVRNMLSTVLDKLEVRDRTQLAIYYWRKQTR